MKFRKYYWVLAFIITFFSCGEKQNLIIEFEELRGLEEDASVLYKGVLVGEVENIELNPDRKLLVQISIIESFELSQRSKFVLFSKDILGTKAIGIIDNDSLPPIDFDEIQIGILENEKLVMDFMDIAKDFLELTKGDLNNKDSMLKELNKIDNKIDKSLKNN